MTKSNRAIKIAISLLLAISLFCCSFSVYAVDPTPEPSVPPDYAPNSRVNMQLQWASYYVYAMLKSWGINVTANSVNEFTDDVKNWIIDIMLDYCLDLGVTVGQWIAPWLFNTDIWGNLMVNDRALRDVQNFAYWLIAKFNLSDNDSVNLNIGININGIKAYKFPLYGYYFRNGQGRDADIAEVDFHGNFIDTYAVFTQVNNNLGVIVISVDQTNAQGISWEINADGLNYIISAGTYYLTYQYINNNWKQAPYDTAPWYVSQQYINFNAYNLILDAYSYYDIDTIQQALYGGVMSEDLPIEIITTVIDLPDDDGDYSDGDSLIIIDGDPTYQLIEWDGQVTVENLPAIISTGELENPEIDQIYTNIPALIDEAGDSMEIFRQIIFRMPDAVLIVLYGLLSAGVIFGFLRIMREH